MTRSDIVLEINRLERSVPKPSIETMALIYALNHKIENIYTIIFTMEKTELFDKIAAMLREAVEK